MHASLLPPSCAAKVLPEFSTLLIKGPYHPSAPVHLCLSCVGDSPDAKALLFTPSRQAYVQALQELNDDWLATFAGHGHVSSISSRIDVYYPPSLAHLAFFLSTLHTASHTTEGTTLNVHAVSKPPSLIVLHELSSYLSQNEATNTVSSYLTLVVQALSAIGQLNAGQTGTSTALALLDSGLDSLKLPITPIIPLSFDPPQQGDGVDGPRNGQPVAPLVERYFEWVGTVTKGSSAEQEDSVPFHLELVRQTRNKEILQLEWSLSSGLPHHNTQRRGTIFR